MTTRLPLSSDFWQPNPETSTKEKNNPTRSNNKGWRISKKKKKKISKYTKKTHTTNVLQDSSIVDMGIDYACITVVSSIPGSDSSALIQQEWMIINIIEEMSQ